MPSLKAQWTNTPVSKKYLCGKGRTLHDFNLEKVDKEQEEILEIHHLVCEEPNAWERGTQKEVQEHCYTWTEEGCYGIVFC